MITSGHSLRRRRHAALAAVARAVSEAAAAADRRAHDAAGDRAARWTGLATSPRRSSSATRRIASWWPSSCASCRSTPQAIVLEPVRAQHRAGDRARRARRAEARARGRCDGRSGAAGAARRSRDPRRRPRSSRRCARRCRRREAGKLVTFGIVADRARDRLRLHPARRRRAGAVFAIARFVEKPDLRARARVRGVRRVLLEQRHVPVPRAPLPRGARALRARRWRASASAAFDAAQRGPRLHAHRSRQIFEACPSDSIDYAVMEKTADAVVVPLDAGWSDVGSWSSLHDGERCRRARQRDARRCASPRTRAAATCTPRAAWWPPSASRTTSSSRPRTRCWSRRRTACRT